jgi:hypothetical protein
MKATIVVADNVIGINGEFKSVILPDMGQVRALQWVDTTGHVEYADGSNVTISDITPYLTILALWGTIPLVPTLVVPVTRDELPALTAWQVRKVLNATGLRDLVEAAVAGSSRDVRDAWQYAVNYRRDDVILNGMAAIVGITQSQLDQMFVEGAKL